MRLTSMMRFLGISGIFIIAPMISVHAAVTSFSFTAAPSALAVNDSSCKFTVTANEAIPETFDIYLESTGDGTFSSSTANWQPADKVTMSTGTANRSFYYRGTSSGSVTITATAKPRSGSESFSAKTTVAIGGTTNCEDGPASASAADNETVAADEENEMRAIDPDPVYATSLIVPDTIMRGIPSVFESIVEKKLGNETLIKINGRYEWSMGDGSGYTFNKNTKVTHTYAYPGVYTVVFRYYSDSFKEKPDFVYKKTMTVLTDALSIERVLPDGAVVLVNDSGKEIDIGGWKIIRGGFSYTIPTYTFISSGNELIIPPGSHQLSVPGTTFLENGQGQILSRYPVQEMPLEQRQVASVKNVSKNMVKEIVVPLVATSSESIISVASHGLDSNGEFALLGETKVQNEGMNLPTLGFIILVLLLLSGYSVYAYANYRKRKNDMGSDGTMGDPDDYDIEEVIKSP